MIRVYLDWQTLNWLRKYNEHPGSVQRKKFNLLNSKYQEFKEHLLIPYSSAHLQDLRKGWDKSEMSKKYTQEDINFISKISHNNCILKYPDEEYAGPYIGHPQEYFDAIKNDDLLNWKFDNLLEDTDPFSRLINNFFNEQKFDFGFEQAFFNLPEDQRDEVKKYFPFSEGKVSLNQLIDQTWGFMNKLLYDSNYYKDLRNYVIKNLQNVDSLDEEATNINEIDDYFKNSQLNSSLIDQAEIIAKSINPKKSPNRYDIFKSLYVLLDNFGVSPEKLKERNSLINITQDADHAFFGSFCDILVSEDSALRKKAKAAYNLLGINTKVYSVDQFNNSIRFLANNPIIDYDEYIGGIIRSLESGLIKDTEFDPSTNTYATHLKLDSQVLNYFNEMASVTSYVFGRYIILNKKRQNYSYFCFYVETQYLVNQLTKIYGFDKNSKGEFQFTKEIDEIKVDKWTGREWEFDTHSVSLMYNKNIRENQLIIKLKNR